MKPLSNPAVAGLAPSAVEGFGLSDSQSTVSVGADIVTIFPVSVDCSVTCGAGVV